MAFARRRRTRARRRILLFAPRVVLALGEFEVVEESLEARVAAWCVPDTGSWRARVFRVDDAFAESEDSSEGEGANEKQSADDDALAEDVARLSLEVFFGGEPSGDAWMRVCVSVGCE